MVTQNILRIIYADAIAITDSHPIIRYACGRDRAGRQLGEELANIERVLKREIAALKPGLVFPAPLRSRALNLRRAPIRQAGLP